MSTTSTLPKEFKLNPRFIVNDKGKKTDVVISFKQYKEIESFLEDFFDGLSIDMRRGEKGIPIGEVEKELKKDGIL